jgi:hypothetical protein
MVLTGTGTGTGSATGPATDEEVKEITPRAKIKPPNAYPREETVSSHEARILENRTYNRIAQRVLEMLTGFRAYIRGVGNYKRN